MAEATLRVGEAGSEVGSQLLDAKAVAPLIGRSTRRASELMRIGEIPSVRRGGRRLSPRPVVEAFARRFILEPPRPGPRPAAPRAEAPRAEAPKAPEDVAHLVPDTDVARQLEEGETELLATLATIDPPGHRLHLTRKLIRKVRVERALLD